MENSRTIRAFWFGSANDEREVIAQQSRLWWAKDDVADRSIARRFAACLALAADGRLDHWAATAQGRLALILLTDQFPRNMYRGSPRSFACDALARKWCDEGLREGADRALRPVERVFFYLPLEHSESLHDQERAVALFEALVNGLPPDHKPAFAGFLDFARRHRDVVQRFGRFPHRNAILGRASTPEELVFLAQPGSAF